MARLVSRSWTVSRTWSSLFSCSSRPSEWSWKNTCRNAHTHSGADPLPQGLPFPERLWERIVETVGAVLSPAPAMDVGCLPTNTAAIPCSREVFTGEMRHHGDEHDQFGFSRDEHVILNRGGYDKFSSRKSRRISWKGLKVKFCADRVASPRAVSDLVIQPVLESSSGEKDLCALVSSAEQMKLAGSMTKQRGGKQTQRKKRNRALFLLVHLIWLLLCCSPLDTTAVSFNADVRCSVIQPNSAQVRAQRALSQFTDRVPTRCREG